MLKTKRVYEPVADGDGRRIFVDRLWPRGITKDEARIDEWRKDLAPSDELRKWFGHDPGKWDEFRRRYHGELQEAGKMADIASLAKDARKTDITLVFGAKDVEHNNAEYLRQLAEELVLKRAA